MEIVHVKIIMHLLCVMDVLMDIMAFNVYHVLMTVALMELVISPLRIAHVKMVLLDLVATLVCHYITVQPANLVQTACTVLVSIQSLVVVNVIVL
jgi:hypothetical protein